MISNARRSEMRSGEEKMAFGWKESKKLHFSAHVLRDFRCNAAFVGHRNEEKLN